MRKIDLTGRKFGRLTVVAQGPKRGKKLTWICKCQCGKTSVAFGSDLRSGKHKSCGCLHLDTITTHGLTIKGSVRRFEYNCWLCMRQRCMNPKREWYGRYGGRGISVCKRWDDFMIFMSDMGPAPSRLHTIERIDNEGNYEPLNCRWATRKEQAQNRRPPIMQYTPDRDPLTGRFVGH